MRLRDHPPVHLTYCLNIHPGEDWADVLAAVEGPALRVKGAVSPDRPFALGLRLGAGALAPARADAEAFAARLRRHGLYALTANAFPFGRFHGTRVKESVYEPDWRDPARLAYTVGVAAWLAALLPEGVEGSVSTVPVGFRAAFRSDAGLDAAAENLAAAGRALRRMREEGGRFVHLGLEPEPGCTVETNAEAADFLERRVFRGRPDEAALRDHVGVCVDTCHAAVQGESASEALAMLRARGVRVSKIQASAGLVAANTPAGRAALAPFAEPTYLHQCTALRGGEPVRRWLDLPDALRELPSADADSVRVHFHVPLHWAGEGELASTRGELDAPFWAAVRAGVAPHVEVETYTFGVLPQALRGADVTESIARELAWAAERAGRTE